MLQGVVALMAAVAVAAALSSGPGNTTMLESSDNTTQCDEGWTGANCTIGPSEAQWMAWEDAHGMPKECEPKKEWSKGPHGEDTFLYYADCSMLAKNHGAAALWSAAAATRKNQGAVFALASKPGKAVRSESGGGPAYKEAARKRLAAKAAGSSAAAVKSGLKAVVASAIADLEPPALPSLLQGPKPKAKPARKPVVKAMKVQVSAPKESSRPLTREQKLRRTSFDRKVKAEEEKLIAKDKQRAAATIVDPDASLANGKWGAVRAANFITKPFETAKKAVHVKSSGPAYKEAARKRLAGKAKKGSSSAADIEPPALPSLLQGPKPKAKPVRKPVVKAMEVQVSALKKSSPPLSLEQKLRKVFFDNKVKQEEAKLIAANQQRADALIVDPDAMVANGQWGASKAASLAAPAQKTARLAAKATGPAAAILQMIGFSANDKYL